MFGLIRSAVSQDRNRFHDGRFDLDLTYITDRIIAMGLPSGGLEGVYRNPQDEVAKMLREYHKANCLVVNLSERKYDYSLFGGRVVEFGFPDHHPAPLSVTWEACHAIDAWLRKDERNVIAVHCKAGKGRTGLIVSCYMIFSGLFYSTEWTPKEMATRSLAYFLRKRGQGVKYPSQVRYVIYYATLVDLCVRKKVKELLDSGRGGDIESMVGAESNARRASLILHDRSGVLHIASSGASGRSKAAPPPAPPRRDSASTARGGGDDSGGGGGGGGSSSDGGYGDGRGGGASSASTDVSAGAGDGSAAPAAPVDADMVDSDAEERGGAASSRAGRRKGVDGTGADAGEHSADTEAPKVPVETPSSEPDDSVAAEPVPPEASSSSIKLPAGSPRAPGAMVTAVVDGTTQVPSPIPGAPTLTELIKPPTDSMSYAARVFDSMHDFRQLPLPRAARVEIQRVVFTGVPVVTHGGSAPYIVVSTAAAQTKPREIVYNSIWDDPKPALLLPQDGVVLFAPKGCVVQGDVMVQCYDAAASGPGSLLFFAMFHTSFISSSEFADGVFRLSLDDLDMENRSSTLAYFPEHFVCDLIFAKVDDATADAAMDAAAGAGAAKSGPGASPGSGGSGSSDAAAASGGGRDASSSGTEHGGRARGDPSARPMSVPDSGGGVALHRREKMGYLNKLGGVVHNWKRRWFVLRNGSVSYYKNKEDATPRGVIPLRECMAVSQVQQAEAGRPMCFKLVHSGRVYIFQAESQAELEDWVMALAFAHAATLTPTPPSRKASTSSTGASAGGASSSPRASEAAVAASVADIDTPEVRAQLLRVYTRLRPDKATEAHVAQVVKYYTKRGRSRDQLFGDLRDKYGEAAVAAALASGAAPGAAGDGDGRVAAAVGGVDGSSADGGAVGDEAGPPPSS